MKPQDAVSLRLLVFTSGYSGWKSERAHERFRWNILRTRLRGWYRMERQQERLDRLWKNPERYAAASKAWRAHWAQLALKFP